ncbi:hypothetical protein NUW54_g14392 [Trametes sanguinea]|uniref:Uncharacterized protein n=1 Tax=Trametes sanguinea TaxID=158606 RepID=A0ACC1MCU8_9APHY|nr:hypothetical protein NUW54_g14392 [Trametes sanguinea]
MAGPQDRLPDQLQPEYKPNREVRVEAAATVVAGGGGVRPGEEREREGELDLALDHEFEGGGGGEDSEDRGRKRSKPHMFFAFYLDVPVADSLNAASSREGELSGTVAEERVATSAHEARATGNAPLAREGSYALASFNRIYDSAHCRSTKSTVCARNASGHFTLYGYGEPHKYQSLDGRKAKLRSQRKYPYPTMPSAARPTTWLVTG